MSIEESYNSWAKQYDTNKNKTRDLDIKSTIETLSKYDFKNVLELGCGTGKNTGWLLTKADRIIGLDFSQEMLDLAKEKISDNNVEFKKSDLKKDWEIENQFADLVTSSLTLEHIDDLNHIFNQANLKLTENGIFFISELHPFKQYTGSKAKYETDNGIEELEVYTHHISDYLDNAKINGFELLEIKEWFDEKSEKVLPRLISFIFRKKKY
jgi:ubiquinone/menaquinone biosynthesis C-methylase UbiE